MAGTGGAGGVVGGVGGLGQVGEQDVQMGAFLDNRLDSIVLVMFMNFMLILSACHLPKLSSGISTINKYYCHRQ